MPKLFLLANLFKSPTDHSKSHFWLIGYWPYNLSTEKGQLLDVIQVIYVGAVKEGHADRTCVFSFMHSRWGCVKLHCDGIVQRVELRECKGSAVAQGRIRVKLLFGWDGQRSWESIAEEGLEDLFSTHHCLFPLGTQRKKMLLLAWLIFFQCPFSAVG